MKIKELRNLPFRKWDEVKTYKSIMWVGLRGLPAC